MITLSRKIDLMYTEKQLRDIAGLIYDTDPYIYPAMFETREVALEVISKMIRAGDTMFRPENLFLATDGDEIVGLILWVKGPLMWDRDIYDRCGGKSPYIDKVCREYFAFYAEAPEDLVSIINVCVKETARGKGIGGRMLDSFLESTKGPYELFVLADNPAAVKLYEKKGFRIVETRQGFSVEPRNLPCYRMIRMEYDHTCVRIEEKGD